LADLRRVKTNARTARKDQLQNKSEKKENVMLHYTIVFLIVALIAAVLGFGVVAGTAALIAKFCFVVFLVLFVVSLISGRGKARL
jgi:uncharacterized membrane protein YtjA (UPF0391 family)